ncbi:MAG: hypothetical protein N2Z73_04710 [Endomicrobia bacterium]|nr:hypothetical protein [Endomicrobiia bacterium]
MKIWIFILLFVSLLEGGKYYEVDIYGNIRSSGTLIVGKKIISPEIQVDTITYNYAQVKEIEAEKINTNLLNIRDKIYNSSGSFITIDTNLVSNYTFLPASLRTTSIYSSIIRIDNLYSNYSQYINLYTPFNFRELPIYNFVVENVNNFPTTNATGRFIYFQGKIWWWDGSVWRDVATTENYTDLKIKKLYPEFNLVHYDISLNREYDLLKLRVEEALGLIEYKKLYQPAIKGKLKIQSNGDFEFISSTSTAKLYVKTELNISSTVVANYITSTGILQIAGVNTYIGRSGDGEIKVPSGGTKDIVIQPGSGGKLEVWSTLDMKNNNVVNVNTLTTTDLNVVSQSNMNNLYTSGWINVSSITCRNDFRVETGIIYANSLNTPISGGINIISGGITYSRIKLSFNDDLEIQPRSGYTVSFINMPTSTTAGSFAGYLVIKVNSTTYKIPLYNP